MKKDHVIAIDLGGTNIRVALVKGQRIVDKIQIPTRVYKKKEQLLEGIMGAVKVLLKNAKRPKSKILGIGIGTAGLVDSQKGIIHHLVNISGWKNVHIKKIFEKALNLPTYVDNDVNVMALAEGVFGAGKGASNILCITVGTGVGAGIIIDKQLYRGSSLSAGEIGHMPLGIGGIKCNCGGTGCMETFVGNDYMVNRTRKLLKGHRRSLILKLACNKPLEITPKLLTKAASLGDKVAIEAWKQTGRYLGIALAGAVNLLNPEVIIIGGGMAGAGKFLFEPVKKTIQKRAMSVPARAVRVVKAKLGNDAGLIGAAELVREEQ